MNAVLTSLQKVGIHEKVVLDIFCRDWPESSSLVKIGHIDGDGISLLQGTESVNVRFERQ